VDEFDDANGVDEVDADENDVRVTAQGRLKSYVAYVLNMFASTEKPTDDVILRGIGRAINKVVTLAEIIKRSVPSLHQVTSIGSSEITDVFPPTEENAEPVTRVRRVSSVTIHLSKTPLDDSDPGYQSPSMASVSTSDATEAAQKAAELFAKAEAARPAAMPVSSDVAAAAGLDLVGNESAKDGQGKQKNKQKNKNNQLNPNAAVYNSDSAAGNQAQSQQQMQYVYNPYFGPQYMMGQPNFYRGKGMKSQRFVPPHMHMTPQQAAAAHQFMMSMSPSAFQQYQQQFQQQQQQMQQQYQQQQQQMSFMVGGAVVYTPQNSTGGANNTSNK
jgi:DNA-binding protein